MIISIEAVRRENELLRTLNLELCTKVVELAKALDVIAEGRPGRKVTDYERYAKEVLLAAASRPLTPETLASEAQDSVVELQDFGGKLVELYDEVGKAILKYGPLRKVRFDAGYNNVSVMLEGR